MTWNEQWKDIREQEDGRFNKLCETKMHYSTKAYWPGYYCKISYNCYYSSFTTSLSGKHCHKAAIELSHLDPIVGEHDRLHHFAWKASES